MQIFTYKPRVGAEDEIYAANAAALSGKLLQLASGAIYDEDGNTVVVHDRKLDALEDLVEAANGQPLLVAYWFKHDRERITKRFPQDRELKTRSDIEAWNARQIPLGLIHPASPRLDGMPRHPDPRAGENRLVATLDKIDLFAERQRQARQYMDWFLPAWQALNADDQFVLENFFLGQGNQDERVLMISEHFYIERDSVYRRKNRALDRLAVALYGRH